MSDNIKPPLLFWVISVIALLWHIFGAVQFTGSVMATPEGMQPYVDSGQLTQDYVDVLLNIPAWVTAAFGIATIGGAIASVCLLLRKKIAAPIFMLSLAGALVMYLYMFVLSGKANVMPTSDFIIAGVVTVVTIFMIWFARRKTASGILN